MAVNVVSLVLRAVISSLAGLRSEKPDCNRTEDSMSMGSASEWYRPLIAGRCSEAPAPA
jgi:hypothetical protein